MDGQVASLGTSVLLKPGLQIFSVPLCITWYGQHPQSRCVLQFSTEVFNSSLKNVLYPPVNLVTL